MRHGGQCRAARGAWRRPRGGTLRRDLPPRSGLPPRSSTRRWSGCSLRCAPRSSLQTGGARYGLGCVPGAPACCVRDYNSDFSPEYAPSIAGSANNAHINRMRLPAHLSSRGTKATRHQRWNLSLSPRGEPRNRRCIFRITRETVSNFRARRPRCALTVRLLFERAPDPPLLSRSAGGSSGDAPRILWDGAYVAQL